MLITNIVASGIGLILLSPLFIILTIWIKCDSIGPVFYKQVRVGRNNMDFQLFKFRSMRVGSDKKGLAERPDVRKKLDELAERLCQNGSDN